MNALRAIIIFHGLALLLGCATGSASSGWPPAVPTRQTDLLAGAQRLVSQGAVAQALRWLAFEYARVLKNNSPDTDATRVLKATVRAHGLPASLEAELRRACERTAEPCFGLAFMLNVRRDYRAGRAVYARACAHGDAIGCTFEAMYLASGRGVSVDYVGALPRLRDACNRGALRACVALGAMLNQGLGVKVDVAQARTLFERACSAGLQFGCAHLADILLLATARDAERAVTLARRGCAVGEHLACAVLGLAYEQGKGGLKASKHDALRLYDAACAAEEGAACTLVGKLLARGGDHARARTFFVRGCDLGYADACFRTGLLLVAQPSLQQGPANSALTFFERACEEGHGFACSRLVYEYVRRNRHPAALKAARRSCELGEAVGCEIAGDTLKDSTPADLAGAVALFERGCSLGRAECCEEAGRLYVRGAAPNLARAIVLLEHACRAKVMRGCGVLGQLLMRPRPGVRADPIRGQQLVQRACAAGIRMRICGGTSQPRRGVNDHRH